MGTKTDKIRALLSDATSCRHTVDVALAEEEINELTKLMTEIVQQIDNAVRARKYGTDYMVPGRCSSALAEMLESKGYDVSPVRLSDGADEYELRISWETAGDVVEEPIEAPGLPPPPYAVRRRALVGRDYRDPSDE